MPLTVKELMDAANAAVPRVTAAQAKDLMAKGALVVDVRDEAAVQEVVGDKAVAGGAVDGVDDGEPLLTLSEVQQGAGRSEYRHALSPGAIDELE